MPNLQQLIRDGEGLTVEFKRCTNELANSVFETVSSFSNRYGGYLLLGVEDNGVISGVNTNSVRQIKSNFINTLNNIQRFAPTLFLALEEVELNGKIVLWCYVPVNSQVVMFGGKIYDRAEDGDMDITRNSIMVAQIHRRKAADYSERKIFPYAKESDFEFERLMPLARRLAVTNRANHPWEKMTDSEIIKSAGLYQSEAESGKSGYTLAAVLLFGREELIRSCTPNYVTDAICRRENLDRYDDRLMVTVNLIDAYGQLIDFICKHTLDRFFLVDGLRVSVRAWIARELVSNVLVHREYTSAFPAKIIIERSRIVTENWCLPKSPGKIDPDAFTPYPKNPLLANFFVNIGRADVLGSGVRNLYKYTKIYSGGEPELIEGDVFKTFVPMDLSDISVSDKKEMSDKMSDNGKMSDKKYHDALLTYLAQNGEISAAEAGRITGRSDKTARRILLQLVDEGLVAATGANRNRRYKINKPDVL
jgi:ATP-dependent DNA helicase RecG